MLRLKKSACLYSHIPYSFENKQPDFDQNYEDLWTALCAKVLPIIGEYGFIKKFKGVKGEDIRSGKDVNGNEDADKEVTEIVEHLIILTSDNTIKQ